MLWLGPIKMTSRLSKQVPRLPRRGLLYVALLAAACCQQCCAQLLGSTSSQVLALSGAALASYITQPAVAIITLRGHITLSNGSWVPDGTVVLSRNLTLTTDQPGTVLDFGLLPYAIVVGTSYSLSLVGITVINLGNRFVSYPPVGVTQLASKYLVLWPSVSLEPNASAHFEGCTLQYNNRPGTSCVQQTVQLLYQIQVARQIQAFATNATTIRTTSLAYLPQAVTNGSSNAVVGNATVSSSGWNNVACADSLGDSEDAQRSRSKLGLIVGLTVSLSVSLLLLSLAALVGGTVLLSCRRHRSALFEHKQSVSSVLTDELQDFYVATSRHSAPLPASSDRSDSDPCPSGLQRSPLTAETPGDMASARLPSLQGSREGQAVLKPAATLASKPGLAFPVQSSDPSGRHSRPSRFSLDRHTLRRVEGSEGAAEGPRPGRLTAGALPSGTSSWFKRWRSSGVDRQQPAEWHSSSLGSLRPPDSDHSTADNPGTSNQRDPEERRGSAERRQTSLEAGGAGEFSSLTNVLKMRADGILSGVELGPLLGRGSYGRVYKGRWRNALVAVKVIEHMQHTNGLDIARESILSTHISHPNCVSAFRICTVHPNRGCMTAADQSAEQLLAPSTAEQAGQGARSQASLSGSVASDHETWMLLEYCDKGSLEHAIERKCFVKKDGAPDTVNVLRCLLDIASGLEFLHSMKVLHGDLKSCLEVLLQAASIEVYNEHCFGAANVMLKSTTSDARGFVCKLGDFGLSRILDIQATYISTKTWGTVSYMPAELLSKGKLTTATDVYSFGMLMWELIKSCRVLQGVSMGQVFYSIVYQGYRPPIDESIPESYAALMKECWAEDFQARPTFDVICPRLAQLYADARKAHAANGMRPSGSLPTAALDDAAAQAAAIAAGSGSPSKASWPPVQD